MANGILKDEATYFNDSSKYIGNSGTETNKWVIEDTYDFEQLGKTGSSSTRNAILVKNIDFRDHEIYKYGFHDISASNHFIEASASILDGNGYSIRNAMISNGSEAWIHFSKIKNVDFVNFITISCSGRDIATDYLENCNFGIFTSDSYYTPLRTPYIENCSFNIKGSLGDSIRLWGNKGNIKRTHINLEITINSSAFISSSSDRNYWSTLENSYITGKVKNTDMLNTYSARDWCQMECVHSYIAVAYTGTSYSGDKREISGTGFIDKELWGQSWLTSHTSISDGYLLTITTAQAQDVNYLNSIGFVVVATE